MNKLFDLIYKNRTFFVFLFLEAIALGMVVSYNSYASASFFNSSNSFSGNIMHITSGVSDYFSFGKQRDALLNNQATLSEELNYYQNRELLYREIELENYLLKKKLAALKSDTLGRIDSIRFDNQNYANFIPAKVISNTVHHVKNYLTINKGKANGVSVGMGVITPNGIVGKVIACSDHYATVMSVLHIDNKISAQVKRTHSLGSVQWPGKNNAKAKLHDVPRHISVEAGDTIITSGFNSIFPEGVIIGIVEQTSLKGSDSFHNIELNLSTEFNNLYHVLVVKNNNKTELDLINAN